MSVKRYDSELSSVALPADDMELVPDGDFVRFEDYEKLKAALDQAILESECRLPTKFDRQCYPRRDCKNDVMFRRGSGVYYPSIYPSAELAAYLRAKEAP